MADDLRTNLQSIADSFVTAVMGALKVATLADVATETKTPRRAAPKAGPATARKPAAVAKNVAAKPARPVAADAKVARPRVGKADVSTSTLRDQVLAYVRAHPNERSERIRAALKVVRPAYLRAVGELLESKKIVKKGERRKTSFSVAG